MTAQGDAIRARRNVALRQQRDALLDRLLALAELTPGKPVPVWAAEQPSRATVSDRQPVTAS